MKKLLKSLLIASSLLLTSNLFAQETICFKKGVTSPSQIETTPLEGVVCRGNLTVNDMKNDGWQILDIQIANVDGKLNYSYYFYKNVDFNSSARPSIMATQHLEVKPIGTKITNIDNNQSVIDIGNLKVGQSGIVVHIYEGNKRTIVSNAKVISSNESSSLVEFFPFDDLKQTALPKTSRQVSTNDVLILNYMYHSSLLIAPNHDTFQSIRSDFSENSFIHSDIFAAKLKYKNRPYPSKEDIQEFAIEQNLGTIFIALDNKIVVLDSKTFTPLLTYSISNVGKDSQIPFFTRVEDIESGLLEFSFFSGSKDLSYSDYYKQILGIK